MNIYKIKIYIYFIKLQVINTLIIRKRNKHVLVYILTSIYLSWNFWLNQKIPFQIIKKMI